MCSKILADCYTAPALWVLRSATPRVCPAARVGIRLELAARLAGLAGSVRIRPFPMSRASQGEVRAGCTSGLACSRALRRRGTGRRPIRQ
eukprot:scaffold9507_cov79-Isochrysis_galbana.AAC.1